MRDAVRFFDNQIRRLSAQQVSDLNPFEQRSVPYLKGRVPDYGCGVGNLSVFLARLLNESPDRPCGLVGALNPRARLLCLV